MRTVVMLCAVLILLPALGGCNTYVNIPAQRGDVARSRVNDATIRRVMAIAGRYAMADITLREPMQVILPAGATVLTYEAVVPQIAEDAAFSPEGLIGEGPMMEIQQIRIRASDAQVDLVRPRSAQRRELVTVHLDWAPVSGWAANRVEVWRPVGPIDPDSVPEVLP